MDVERYPNGRIKYKQYSKERYEKQKTKEKKIIASVTPQLAEDFEAKVALEGTTRNAKLKGWIEAYCYGDQS